MMRTLIQHMRREEGVSLIEVLIAVGILALTALAASGGFGQLSNSMRAEKMLSDKVAARNAIINAMDCTATMTPMPACNNRTPLTLKDISGANLTQGSGTIGSWRISAVCNTTGIVVNGLWTGGNTDPLTNAPLNWVPLFPAGASFCRLFSMGQQPIVRPNPVQMSITNARCHYLFNKRSAVSWEGWSNQCPAGYMAISGGPNCGPDSVTQASQPTGTNYNRWYARCCVSNNNNVPSVYVLCAATAN